MKNKAHIIVHSIFWLIILSIMLTSVFFGAYQYTFSDIYLRFGFVLVINVSVFYINYLFLIPQLIINGKKYGLYILSIILLILSAAALKTVVASLNPDSILTYIEKKSLKPEHIEINHYAISTVFSSGFLVVISLLLRLAIDWFSNERKQRNLESEKREMELQFLKSQLNPHFLFNSLNNIYSLAYQKSDKTANAILKLSEIMRYMIYESNDCTVSLSKEVEYLKNYIELQKLRFKDGAYVELHLNGEIEDQKIVPLMLISFVENAFKHGVVTDPADPVKINLIANQKILHFSITNKKNTHHKDEMGGVGLSNVERRLQLTYPERYKLNIVNSATHYTSELMIDI